MKQTLLETLEWVQKSLNDGTDPDLIIAEVANAIADAKEPKEKLTVKRWIYDGNLSGKCMTQDEIIEECSNHLDSAYACEILGQVVFEATNGKHYVITTEAIIGEGNPEYIEELLEDEKENGGN